MSTSSVAYYNFAAPRPRRSARKAGLRGFTAVAAIASLVLGCAWTVYANIFAASPYPQLGGAGLDEPVARQRVSVAIRRESRPENLRLTQLEAPAISAPETVPVGPSLSFDDRFAAASPQGVAPAPVPQDDPVRIAEAPKVQGEKTRAPETSRPRETPRVQLAAISPALHPNEPPPARTPADTFRDMAQRAKAAVMSIASNERQTLVEKLWGKQPSHGPLLAYASADASATGSIGPVQNPALGGSAPYDRSTAVYDISAHTVYLPDGTRLEAHSGLGSKLDDPTSANVRMRGVTPPHVYELKPREALFHGVPALRLTPVGGEEAIYGRSGLLAHTYMLGPNGDSNGCVSFRDYNAFLNAYRNQGIRKLAVVARID
jgi:type VI secretion system (T6SS) effector TldE1-like protein